MRGYSEMASWWTLAMLRSPMKFGMRPAACHVDPDVSSPFSTRIVSVHPSCASAYSKPAPIAPPPTITHRACSGMLSDTGRAQP